MSQPLAEVPPPFATNRQQEEEASSSASITIFNNDDQTNDPHNLHGQQQEENGQHIEQHVPGKMFKTHSRDVRTHITTRTTTIRGSQKLDNVNSNHTVTNNTSGRNLEYKSGDVAKEVSTTSTPPLIEVENDTEQQHEQNNESSRKQQDRSPPSSSLASPEMNGSATKRKKSVTFHPEVVTSSRSVSPTTHFMNGGSDDLIGQHENEPSFRNDSDMNGVGSVFFKHPAWLVYTFQHSWRVKLQEYASNDSDEPEENLTSLLTLDKIMSRPIDIESPIWYFLPKRLIQPSTIENDQFKINNYQMDEDDLEPKFEVYFNYWAQLRDSLFLRLRKENKKLKSEKSSNAQLWYGYHNAAILSFFIETQKDSLHDLQKALHFRIFDLLFESMAQTNQAENAENVTLISDQELTLMKTVCFFYIETEHLFHATSVLYHVMRNYCFTAESYQKLVQKWSTSDLEKSEIYPSNIDWKVVYLILRLISKYLEILERKSTESSFVSQLQYDEFCKVDRGLSQFSQNDLLCFRNCVIEQICKYKPNHDLYLLWKDKWQADDISNSCKAFPRIETEPELLENCFYIIYLIISKERERISEKGFTDNNTNTTDFKPKVNESRSKTTLLSKLGNYWKKLRVRLFGNSSLMTIILYIAGVLGTAFILKIIYQFFNTSSLSRSENQFNLSRNDLRLPYLTSSQFGSALPSKMDVSPLHQQQTPTTRYSSPSLNFEIAHSTKPSSSPVATLGTSFNTHPENRTIHKDNIRTILKPSNFKQDFYEKVDQTNGQVDRVVERDFNYISSLRDEMDHVFDIAEKMKQPKKKSTSEDIKQATQKPVVTFQVGEDTEQQASSPVISSSSSIAENVRSQPTISIDTSLPPSDYTPMGFGSDELPPFPSTNQNRNLATFIGSEGVSKSNVVASNRLNNLNRTIGSNRKTSTTTSSTTRKKTSTPNTGGPKVLENERCKQTIHYVTKMKSSTSVI
ncbi:hypothetical protein C9374_008099 [Naegleria lovaniensis]|uniref:Uncharacterized protein n=1 Tax=Naegleria lovaniensis TaxID=51637 RepID=A0AA88KG98_NAELO|nr:uncharacterized protein C9374_008099 [Naegleria lovaniensis]KAG2378460.1 hypothetical protein C9374_008099 [Naegleria lovaniensis]